ncbi:hypothetical protein [Bacillus sp. RS11]|uniref:hypothetical protein n=1 Tax=Lysinibacillus sp. RS11 TaxID=3242682 RepID=UPI0035C6B643
MKNMIYEIDSNEFKDIKTGVRTDKLRVVQDKLIKDYDAAHKDLEEALSGSVECLENEIKNLLKMG